MTNVPILGAVEALSFLSRFLVLSNVSFQNEPSHALVAHASKNELFNKNSSLFMLPLNMVLVLRFLIVVILVRSPNDVRAFVNTTHKHMPVIVRLAVGRSCVHIRTSC